MHEAMARVPIMWQKSLADGSLECLDIQFDELHDLPFGSTFKIV
jgi:hypothetical protein